jgi:hypothetical protein
MSEDIEIRIEFERSQGDPTRVFRAMADLIDSVKTLDSHLALSIGAGIKTTLLLQDIESASLKAKLRSVIEDLPDEALRAGEVKKVIGHFLVKAKHKIIDWCGERDEITTRQEVKQLEMEIQELATQSNVLMVPAYMQVSVETLLSDIASLNGALSYLNDKDSASFRSSSGYSTYNSNLVVSEGVVKEILTRETISSKGERILKVKKPDYLGTSKWSFKYSDHMIEAKISHSEWLKRFQSNLERVNPGDSLRVFLEEHVGYGYNNEIVHTDYEILQILEIIPGPREVQGLLPGT